MKSNFKADLQKEKTLYPLLDDCYRNQLIHYTATRVHDIQDQKAGIDVVFTHKTSKTKYFIDEKAQLYYINEDLPTFAFELGYFLDKNYKQGWLFDSKKKTDFYALVTAIYADEPEKYTSCKITLVNRKKLVSFLKDRQITSDFLDNYKSNKNLIHGKIEIKSLNQRTEGYGFISSNNKEEKPINLILKLAFLLEKGIAKRLI